MNQKVFLCPKCPAARFPTKKLQQQHFRQKKHVYGYCVCFKCNREFLVPAGIAEKWCNNCRKESEQK